MEQRLERRNSQWAGYRVPVPKRLRGSGTQTSPLTVKRRLQKLSGDGVADSSSAPVFECLPAKVSGRGTRVKWFSEVSREATNTPECSSLPGAELKSLLNSSLGRTSKAPLGTRRGPAAEGNGAVESNGLPCFSVARVGPLPPGPVPVYIRKKRTSWSVSMSVAPKVDLARATVLSEVTLLGSGPPWVGSGGTTARI